jgi:hypothetical protein
MSCVQLYFKLLSLVMRTRLRTMIRPLVLTGAHAFVMTSSVVRLYKVHACPSLRRSITCQLCSVHHPDRRLARRDSAQGYYFPYFCDPFSHSHSFPDLERNRLHSLPWSKHIHGPRWYLHPRQTDLYHACLMGISHLVCTSSFANAAFA